MISAEEVLLQQIITYKSEQLKSTMWTNIELSLVNIPKLQALERTSENLEVWAQGFQKDSNSVNIRMEEEASWFPYMGFISKLFHAFMALSPSSQVLVITGAIIAYEVYSNRDKIYDYMLDENHNVITNNYFFGDSDHHKNQTNDFIDARHVNSTFIEQEPSLQNDYVLQQPMQNDYMYE